MRVESSTKLDNLAETVHRRMKATGENIFDRLSNLALVSASSDGMIDVSEVVDAFEKAAKAADSCDGVVKVYLEDEGFDNFYFIPGTLAEVTAKIESWGV